MWVSWAETRQLREGLGCGFLIFISGAVALIKINHNRFQTSKGLKYESDEKMYLRCAEKFGTPSNDELFLHYHGIVFFFFLHFHTRKRPFIFKRWLRLPAPERFVSSTTWTFLSGVWACRWQQEPQTGRLWLSDCGGRTPIHRLWDPDICSTWNHRRNRVRAGGPRLGKQA